MSKQNTNLVERAALEGSYQLSTLSWAQLQAGAFDVHFGIVEAPPLRIAVRSYNLALQVEAAVERDRMVTALLAEPTGRARWFANDMSADTLACTRSDIDIRTDGPSSFFSVTLDEPALQARYPNSADAATLVSGAKCPGLTHHPTQAARLRTAIRLTFARQAAKTTPAAVAARLIPILADTVEVLDNHAVEQSKCINRRFAAVRRCEAYMWEHIDSSVTLLDLSIVCGMRSRSLINAFEAVTGLSPMDYLKRLRLNGARRALRRARKTRTRIIDVATAWGFWHMGHFATDYRALFGEAPSQTLLNA